MSFMVRYCEKDRKAWPVTEGDKCPDCGGPTLPRDSIALVNNLGKEVASLKLDVGVAESEAMREAAEAE